MTGPSTPEDIADSVLLEELARLPLVELVRLDQTSPRRRQLQEAALARTLTLNVVVGNAPMALAEYSRFKLKYTEWIEPDLAESIGVLTFDPKPTLMFASLDHVDVQWFASSMPKLQKLVLVYHGVEQTASVQQVATFFNRLLDTLVELTLLLCFPEWDMSPEAATQLFDGVNKLPHLKHLHLAIFNRIPGDTVELLILAQLDTFQYYSTNNKNYLLSSLLRHGQNNGSLKMVILGDLEAFSLQDNNLRSKVLRVLPEFEHINDFLAPNDALIELACSNFSRLTYFQAKVDEFTAERLSHELAKLTQLVYLELDITESYSLLIGDPCLCCFPPAQKDPARPEGPQLLSVKVFCLTMDLSYHHEDLVHMFNFGWVMPNLLVVEIKEEGFKECETCRLENPRLSEFGKVGWTQVAYRPDSCLHQLMAPFRDCRQLRKIVHIQLERNVGPRVTDLSDLFSQ